MDGGVHLVQTIAAIREDETAPCRSMSCGAVIAAGR